MMRDDDDEPLRQAMRASMPPAPRDVTPMVRKRIARRRALRRGQLGMLAAGIAAMAIYLTRPDTATETAIALRPEPAQALEAGETAVLFAPPPVDDLQGVGRGQDALVELLQTWDQE